jgi:hypothetical protein
MPVALYHKWVLLFLKKKVGEVDGRAEGKVAGLSRHPQRDDK